MMDHFYRNINNNHQKYNKLNKLKIKNNDA